MTKEEFLTHKFIQQDKYYSICEKCNIILYTSDFDPELYFLSSREKRRNISDLTCDQIIIKDIIQ